MEEEVPSMVVQECEVVVMMAVTGKACQPLAKSPGSGVGRGVSYIGSLIEYV